MHCWSASCRQHTCKCEEKILVCAAHIPCSARCDNCGKAFHLMRQETLVQQLMRLENLVQQGVTRHEDASSSIDADMSCRGDRERSRSPAFARASFNLAVSEASLGERVCELLHQSIKLEQTEPDGDEEPTGNKSDADQEEMPVSVAEKRKKNRRSPRSRQRYNRRRRQAQSPCRCEYG